MRPMVQPVSHLFVLQFQRWRLPLGALQHLCANFVLTFNGQAVQFADVVPVEDFSGED